MSVKTLFILILLRELTRINSVCMLRVRAVCVCVLCASAVCECCVFVLCLRVVCACCVCVLCVRAACCVLRAACLVLRSVYPRYRSSCHGPYPIKRMVNTGPIMYRDLWTTRHYIYRGDYRPGDPYTLTPLRVVKHMAINIANCRHIASTFPSPVSSLKCVRVLSYNI